MKKISLPEELHRTVDLSSEFNDKLQTQKKTKQVPMKPDAELEKHSKEIENILSSLVKRHYYSFISGNANTNEQTIGQLQSLATTLEKNAKELRHLSILYKLREAVAQDRQKLVDLEMSMGIYDVEHIGKRNARIDKWENTK